VRLARHTATGTLSAVKIVSKCQLLHSRAIGPPASRSLPLKAHGDEAVLGGALKPALKPSLAAAAAAGTSTADPALSACAASHELGGAQEGGGRATQHRRATLAVPHVSEDEAAAGSPLVPPPAHQGPTPQILGLR
jgi:hypothetical protein